MVTTTACQIDRLFLRILDAFALSSKPRQALSQHMLLSDNTFDVNIIAQLRKCHSKAEKHNIVQNK